MGVKESVDLAYESMDNKNYSMAILHLETAIQYSNFGSSDLKHLVYHSLGVCYLELKAFDDAISALKSCVALTPPPTETADYVSLADTHHFLSKAYEEKSAFSRNPLLFVGGMLLCH